MALKSSDIKRILAAKKTRIIIIALFSMLLLSEECSENQIIRSVNIAPNPANDHIVLTIELSVEIELYVSIYDSNGNLVLEPVKGLLYASGSNRIEILTYSLRSGMYFCKIQAEGEIKTEKFVIVG